MTDPANLTPEQRIKALEQQLQVMSQKTQFFEAAAGLLIDSSEIAHVIELLRGDCLRKF